MGLAIGVKNVNVLQLSSGKLYIKIDSIDSRCFVLYSILVDIYLETSTEWKWSWCVLLVYSYIRNPPITKFSYHGISLQSQHYYLNIRHCFKSNPKTLYTEIKVSS